MTFLTDYFQTANAPHRRQLDVVLKTWRDFLEDMGTVQTLEQLMTDASVWQEVTGTLVSFFRQRLLNAGYATPTIDRRLALLRLIIRQAQGAGANIPSHELQKIDEIRGYGGRRGTPIPYTRSAQREDAVALGALPLSAAQADQLKHTHPNTPRGRRDAMLMCLLLDEGLRIIDIPGLQVEEFDLARGILQRPGTKAGTHQTRTLTEDTHQALRHYLADHPALQQGPLCRIIKRDDTLGKGMRVPRDIAERVKAIGMQILGIPTLTPEICYTYWVKDHLPSIVGEALLPSL